MESHSALERRMLSNSLLIAAACLLITRKRVSPRLCRGSLNQVIRNILILNRSSREYLHPQDLGGGHL